MKVKNVFWTHMRQCLMKMSVVWLAWIIAIHGYVGSRGTPVGETRLDIVLALAKHFNVAFCVVAKPQGHTDFTLISSKTNPSKRLLTGFLSFNQISRFMKGDEDLHFKRGGRTMIILNAANDTLEYLSQLSHNETLSTAIWILFSESEFHPKLFRDIYVPFDCEFICVSQSDHFYNLTEVYQVKKKAEVETYEYGFWTKEDGLVVADIYFYARRNNLKGHNLTAIVNNNPPYVSIARDDKGEPKFSGYLYEIWNELEYRLNFRTEFPEEYLGKDVEKVLKNDEVDFALARVSIASSALESMDFSLPIHEAKSYMFGHRTGSELDWNSYLKPFSTNTWFVSIIWMISSSLALALLYRKAWASGTSEREANYYIFTFSESILTVFRAVCMQGSDVTPRSNSCRFFFLSIYLTALVVTSAFSAALFSLLTIPKPRSPFSGLEEVLNNKKFTIGFPSDPNFHKLVEDFSATLVLSNQIKLLEKLAASKDSLPATPQQGLQKICQDKFYIFMFDLPDVLYLMQNTTRSCRDKILPSGPLLFTEFIGFVFKKKNPYRGLINFHLIRMKNEGILKRLLLNYWPPQIPTVQATWVRVTLSDISPILYMFTLGALLGTVFLYAEKVLIHFRKRNKKETKHTSSYHEGPLLEPHVPSTDFHKSSYSHWSFYY